MTPSTVINPDNVLSAQHISAIANVAKDTYIVDIWDEKSFDESWQRNPAPFALYLHELNSGIEDDPEFKYDENIVVPGLVAYKLISEFISCTRVDERMRDLLKELMDIAICRMPEYEYLPSRL